MFGIAHNGYTAAKLPYVDPGLGLAVAIQNQVTSSFGGPAQSGSNLPYVLGDRQVAAVGLQGTPAQPEAAPTATASTWKAALDPRSPAFWFLVGLLLLVGWLQVSFHASARGGRAHIGAGGTL
jgi:hypothetical protein